MPKLKSHRGAAKRFKKTSSGKLQHKQSYTRHILTKKKSKRKRHLRGLKMVDASHQAQIEQMLPNL